MKYLVQRYLRAERIRLYQRYKRMGYDVCDFNYIAWPMCHSSLIIDIRPHRDDSIFRWNSKDKRDTPEKELLCGMLFRKVKKPAAVAAEFEVLHIEKHSSLRPFSMKQFFQHSRLPAQQEYFGDSPIQQPLRNY